jgi:hypothetical protein
VTTEAHEPDELAEPAALDAEPLAGYPCAGRYGEPTYQFALGGGLR